MIDSPDFSTVKVVHGPRVPTRASLDSQDHVIVAVAAREPASALRKWPYHRELERTLARARRQERKIGHSRLPNARSTTVTVAIYEAAEPFGALTWARHAIGESLRERPHRLAMAAIAGDAATARAATESLVSAAAAAAFDMPSFKTGSEPRASLRSVTLLADEPRTDLNLTLAQALGNNVARWFTALPPNLLTAASYRQAIEELIEPYSIRSRFLGERELRKAKAGAFLAVAQGNVTRDAGILHLRYRPARSASPDLALVGKGILFDTGGTNLKAFKHMLDMHTDMQGSAVALGVLLALARLKVPYGVDAWLAITENRLSAAAYKSQDIVYAANGTSIQVIHTDAEGRMVLADTLALAAREEPKLIIDYATLTGSCITALTSRYSGAFSNRTAANPLLIDAGIASGERVWPFPMNEDFDELLKSEIADVKQCTVDGEGDHILAARFLNRFVPSRIPWIHLDLAAGQHKGGLAHVPSEITGFGVRLTLELLLRQADSAAALASKLTA